MAPERFPVAFVFLDVPHFAVDVNVHPAKLECKFENEREVFECVYYAVRTALEECVSRPSLGMEKGKKSERDFALAHSFDVGERPEQIKMPATLAPAQPKPTPKAAPITSSLPPVPVPKEFAPITVMAKDPPKPSSATLTPKASIELCERYAEAQKEAEAYLAKIKAKKPEENKPTPSPTVKETAGKETDEAKVMRPTLPEYRILGTAFKTYIFVELPEETMLVIDQHAAHERILFERMKKEQKEKKLLSVPLLLPIAVEVTAEERAYAETESEALDALGFTYSLAESKAHLLSIPADVTPAEAKDLFLSLLGEGSLGASPTLTEEMRREKLLYQIACKAAIKGGRQYDEAHISWLVEEVLSLPDVTVCPHGRPIAFHLTKKELDRQFDRIK